MKKRIFSFLLFAFGIALHGWSQSIMVINEDTKLPVAYSFVSIKAAVNGKVQQFQTDDLGQINLYEAALSDSNTYTVDVKSIGYYPYFKKLNGAKLKALGAIVLKPNSLKLNEVVVTGQYEPTLAEKSVQKIKVIDAKKIEAMGAANLKDVLLNEMNIRITQDNVLGAGMQLDCIGGENVKILLDGVPVIGRMNGNIDLSQINVNNVERIEIVEGPMSVQYGTNALAGTINLITKKIFKNKYGLSISPYYESIGTYNVSATADASFKKSSLSVSGGRNFFDGWNPGDQPFTYEKEHMADTTRYQQWKSKEQYFASLSYTYSFKRLNLGYSSSYFKEKILNRGMPRAPYYETAFDDHYYTTRFDNSISLAGKLSGNWNVNSNNAYNYYNRTKNTFYRDLTTLAQVITENPSDQDTTAFSLLMSRTSFSRTKDSAMFNFEFGYDINYESALGKRIENKIQYMGDFALFATTEFRPVRQLIIKPGLRYTYNTTYRSPLVPSVNLKYELNDKNAIRANYGRGFRAPALKELYFYFVDINHNITGNLSLEAEQSNNFSLSFSSKAEIKSATLRSDIAIYYNDIKNLITLAQVNSVEYSYVNVGRFKTMGAGINENLDIKNFRINIGYAYSGRYNELSETKEVQPFSYSSELNASSGYYFEKIKTTLSLFYKYNGRLPGYALNENDEVIQTYLSDYHLFDLSISKTLFSERLVIALGCKNIFDVKNLQANYASAGAHSSSASSVAFGTGRNYFIKLTFKLWKEL